MDRIVIQGGVPLKGEVSISGAKNAALPLMAACLLTEETCRIENLPALRDVESFLELLRRLGVRAESRASSVDLRAAGLRGVRAPYDLVRKMRASVLVLGPLVARTGKAAVSLPGGCAIGVRPIDQHLKGLAALGVEIVLKGGYIHAKARGLKGAEIFLDLVTVTGTMNLMMAAALADGRTRLHGAAREPEVVQLAEALRAMGAEVRGEGTDAVEVVGAPRLKGFQVRIIPDRIEAGTYLLAGAVTGGEVCVTGAVAEHVRALSGKLAEAGADICEEGGRIRVRGRRPVRAVDFQTAPYPGFATDLQAQMMVLLCLARGASVITETIFENRFMHVAELRRMGAVVRVEGNRAVVEGVERLAGAEVMATDLRASASLILAGLAAEGETVVNRVYHVDRGYERIEEKLSALGARIERVR
ncbi:MAG: UDP-N-acetylglucosamine 1-carboxyvinyltransferase [Candidatus Tectomicrobia bacterium]|nr:UDP-N-acetylglucosamine 1-carboxyvinyltransferase [Candidatus Tectomicrobia bacterium]